MLQEAVELCHKLRSELTSINNEKEELKNNLFLSQRKVQEYSLESEHVRAENIEILNFLSKTKLDIEV
jgi:hypothetical protein